MVLPIIKDSDEFYIYVLDLEKEWESSLLRFTDKELLDIFPEAKRVIPKRIKEWEEKREKIVKVIQEKLILIRNKASDEFSKWFWREWVKVNEGEELLKIDRHIARLKRLFAAARGWESKGKITEEKIQQALSVPIENIAYQQNVQLKKCGKALVGLCPIHQEKTPSFFVYPDSNSFYCYGCNQGGNSINLVRLLYGYSFKEAVQYLIGEK